MVLSQTPDPRKKLALDDSLDNHELNFFRGSGVRGSTILEEQVLRIFTLVDEKIHVTPIINNQVWYANLTITLRLYQGIQDAVPVLLETLTLPGKHSSRCIMRNDIHSVLLVRENFARSPTEVTAEGFESLKKYWYCILNALI